MTTVVFLAKKKEKERVLINTDTYVKKTNMFHSHQESNNNSLLKSTMPYPALPHRWGQMNRHKWAFQSNTSSPTHAAELVGLFLWLKRARDRVIIWYYMNLTFESTQQLNISKPLKQCQRFKGHSSFCQLLSGVRTAA